MAWPSSSSGKATASSTTVAANPVSTELRSVATRLTAADGPSAPDAGARLQAVAAAVDHGGGGPEANALLATLAVWRTEGGLSAPAVTRISAALLNVPGADMTVLAPTTQPPIAKRGEGKSKGSKDHND
jgi:hypothetical protein